MEHKVRIGEAAKATGLSVDAIRFYQKERLLGQPARTEGGFRLFGRDEIQSLLFIRKAQDLGFSLSDIRQLLVLGSERAHACSQVRLLLKEKAAAVREKIGQLKRLEGRIQHSLRKCEREMKSKHDCHNGHCPVLEEIRLGEVSA